MGPRLRPLLVLLAVAPVALALGGGAQAGTPPTERLERALEGSGVPLAERGILVLDRRSGRVVYRRNPMLPLVPASNEKLPVSIAALRRLGPGFRFRTTVLGRGQRTGRTWRGNLILRGSGDPTLTSDDLAALARKLRAKGIRRVQGRVIGDETRYDIRRTAPGWSRAARRYCPPLSALVVDWGLLDGRFAGDPARAAAVLFRRQLAAHGILVTGRNGVGRAAADARPLVAVRSEPLADVVASLNRHSDNLIAELLLKELDVRAGGAGTTRGGARVVRRVLGELLVPLGGVRIVDGSGLSRGNRITAGALARLLVVARKTPGLARPFVRSLAVAGRTGTLASRLHGTPAKGTVVGKTGTTSRSSALSGYVGSRYVFAILMNGAPVPSWSARAGQDRFVSVLAAHARVPR